MWSGPRNLSTALMRSFENRTDTEVWDEPLYAYYLKETKKNHPLAKNIISMYETNLDKLLLQITNSEDIKHTYQKHMTHHVLDKTPIEWIENGINCFLIRNPKEVIKSYIKKNKLVNSDDIGFPMQIKLFNFVKKSGQIPIIINAEDLIIKPKETLLKLCKNLNIPFSEIMLKWPIGKRISDGIWGEIWYKNVESSSEFKKNDKEDKDEEEIPNKFNNIYLECLDIYDELNTFNILNER